MASAVNRLQGSAGGQRFKPIGRWVPATAMLVAALAALDTWANYRFMCGSLRQHAYRELEGVVTAFVPEDDGVHRHEQFRVGGMLLAYSAYWATLAFHQTALRGGPIHDGLHVRIAEVNGAILRLEIAQ